MLLFFRGIMKIYLPFMVHGKWKLFALSFPQRNFQNGGCETWQNFLFIFLGGSLSFHQQQSCKASCGGFFKSKETLALLMYRCGVVLSKCRYVRKNCMGFFPEKFFLFVLKFPWSIFIILIIIISSLIKQQSSDLVSFDILNCWTKADLLII